MECRFPGTLISGNPRPGGVNFMQSDIIKCLSSRCQVEPLKHDCKRNISVDPSSVPHGRSVLRCHLNDQCYYIYDNIITFMTCISRNPGKIEKYRKWTSWGAPDN